MKKALDQDNCVPTYPIDIELMTGKKQPDDTRKETGWKEDKEEIVEYLEGLLLVTRAGIGIADMKLNEKQDKVIIRFDSGSYKEIDIAGDSGIAIIKDVVKHL